VFFLGLLSTPMPYLLLAAFYFFGFAMGMFNNSNGEEATEKLASVTIPVEVKQKTTDNSVYYYQINTDQKQNQSNTLKTADSTFSFIPDSENIVFQFRNIKVHESLFSGFQFSRPPPFGC